MTLFKAIEIDMEAERARINGCRSFNERQRKALHTLCDLFEAGEWQKCLDHVRNKDAFPYNEADEYPEDEHIGIEIGDVLSNLGGYNFYTQGQLLEEAKAKLAEAK